MSTVNVSTIYTEFVNASGNVFIGTVTSNVAILSNNTISVGSNVSINSSYISVSNSTGNTQINSIAISTTGITVGGVFVNTSDSQISDYQSFVANGTWIKPSWAQANDLVTIMAWGAGAGGISNSGTKGLFGGGGGACVVVHLSASKCNAVCNVVVGQGAVGTLGSVPGSGVSGTVTRFFPNTSYSINAYSGCGPASVFDSYGGSGGGTLGYANTTNGGGGPPAGGYDATSSDNGYNSRDSTFGGGGGGSGNNSQISRNGGSSIYGGGGGGASNTMTAIGIGGNSVYGGGGGGGGVSIFGGNGGSMSASATSIAGFAPGGGGGANTTNGGAGARGEVRIWVQKVT